MSDPTDDPGGGARVSEVPFVHALGEQLDAAVMRSSRGGRRSRRWFRGPRGLLLIGAVGVVALATAASMSDVFSPERAATGSIACYQADSVGGNLSVVWAGTQTPVAACRAALRGQGVADRPLVACQTSHSVVAVVPGVDARACTRAGLAPLAAGYSHQREKVAHLQAAILRLEASADCIPPARFKRDVQRLLDTSGWRGWSAQLGRGTGRCGSVSDFGGAPRRTIAGALLADSHVVLVSSGPSRSLANLLWGPNSAARRLEDMSGRRCMSSTDALSAARKLLPLTGVPVTLHVAPLPSGEQIFDARASRYAAGCVVVSGLTPTRSGGVLVSAAQEPDPS
jgi:hypothetical protein